MGFVVLLGAILFIGIPLIITFSFVAYFEGKDDATRYYGSYDNSYWMPLAYFYNMGYAKWEGRSRTFVKDKNKKRFNRE